jgi:hypothetical protein
VTATTDKGHLRGSDELRAAARLHREAARERLAGLRGSLREALAAKKTWMRTYAEECARERLAVRGAIAAMRQDALARLRDEGKALRQAARDQRAARLAEVRGGGATAVATARAVLAAHRQHDAEQRRITLHERRRKAVLDKLHAQTLKGSASHGAKLDKLRPLLARARTAPTAPGESKAGALWRYARAHPEEMHALLEPKAEQAIAQTKAEISEVETSVRSPSVFARKRAARAERMRTRAARLRTEAEGAFAREHAMGNRFSMGQPILVGHHSERRHRRDLARMDALRKKGLTLAKEAQGLEHRATSAETNPAVSSDDPEAVAKLRAKLASLEQERARMRATNAAIRAGGNVVARLVGLGHSEARAKELLQKDFAGRVGFPAYVLQNTSSEERRIKERIRQLEARAASPPRSPETIGSATIADALRSAMKAAGFRWAPSEGTWQRFASRGAWEAARRLLAAHASAPSPLPASAAPASPTPG